MSNHCSNMVKPYWTAVKPHVTFIIQVIHGQGKAGPSEWSDEGRPVGFVKGALTFTSPLQPCGTNLPLGWKPQSFLAWSTFQPTLFGASNQMQPRSTCVLVQLLLRCSGPVPLPTVRQPRPNDTPYRLTTQKLDRLNGNCPQIKFNV